MTSDAAEEQAGTAGVVPFMRAHPAFGRLWAARAVSFLGDSVGLVGLLLYVARHEGSGLAVALLMIAGDFAPSLVSPLAGGVADLAGRAGARWLMPSCELAQAAVIVAIALALPGLPLLLPLVAARATIATVFQAASRSVVPSLVPGSQLAKANAVLGMGTNGLDVIGPLLAAVLLPWLTIPGLLLLDAATFAVSAALLLTLPAVTHRAVASRAARASAREPFLAGAKEGVAYIWRQRYLRVIAIGFCAVVLFNAVDDVALVYLARDSLHAPAWGMSLLYAGVGAGLLAGFAWLTRFPHQIPVVPLLLAGYLVSSLGNLLTGTAWAIAAAFGFQCVRGLGLSAMDTAHDTLIQRIVPADLLGRVFANVYGAVSLAAGLSYLLGGLLLDATNPRATLIAAGAGGAAVTPVVAWRLRAAARCGHGTGGHGTGGHWPGDHGTGAMAQSHVSLRLSREIGVYYPARIIRIAMVRRAGGSAR